jgi:hypothetical protein
MEVRKWGWKGGSGGAPLRRGASLEGSPTSLALTADVADRAERLLILSAKIRVIRGQNFSFMEQNGAGKVTLWDIPGRVEFIPGILRDH